MQRLPIVFLSIAVWIASGQTDVLTANFNDSRTSANLTEYSLDPSTVSPTTFGKVGSFPVVGQIYAQPLVVTNLDLPGCGTCDVLYVATMENNVYAFNASTLDPTPLWSANLGPAAPNKLLRLREIDPSIGVLSTPTISRSRGAIYIVSESLRNGTVVFSLHALDLRTGGEILNGPTDVTGFVNGAAEDAVDGRVVFDPMKHIQRPGLLAANGRIFIAFGSIADRLPYHGWIMSHDMNDVSLRVSVFNATPNGVQGGIWQSGRGLVAGPKGEIYLGTGNGDYDGLRNFGESFLHLDAELKVIDWFTPADNQERSDVDLDLASQGPILIPSLDLILGGDKESNAYLMDRWNMGHLGLAGASTPQIFQPIGWGGLFNSALWDRSDGPLAYFVDQGTATYGWRIDPNEKRFEREPFSWNNVTSDYPWQGIAVSANGDTGGILWITAGDHGLEGVPGILLAYNAEDLTQLLWTSETNPDTDRLGGFAKFATPTIANGLVFVPTFSNQVVVYGLLSSDAQAQSAKRKL